MTLKTQDYFSGLARVYDANRPGYPIEAIDATLEGLPRPLTVADIGCGTGISSRLLKMRGGDAVRIIGVDPNEDMLQTARSAARAAALDIDFLAGSGERTGLDDASVDLVVCAQAFHWLRPLEALCEFRRILRASGRLALIWNVRDDDHDAFTAAYSEIARRSQANARAHGFQTHDLRSANPTIGGYFSDAFLRAFPNPHRLTLDGLLGRARSASYFPRPGDPLRQRLESELAALFTEHARDGVVLLWHRTEVTAATPVNQS